MSKLFITLFLLVLFTSSLFAAKIFVPEDYPTIQAGIDAVPDGDTLIVGPGTYTGPGNVDLTFNGKNLALLTRGGSRSVTIDCNGSPEDPHVAFIFDNNETAASKITGLRVINAYKPGFFGAFTFLHASATVSNCIIENNDIPGIMFSNYSTLGVVQYCDIYNNTAGIGYASPVCSVSNCNIMNNTGNGITSRGQLDLQNSVVAYNNSFGLFNANGVSQPVTINNCTFAFNYVGIHYETELPKTDILATADITNSIIAYNQTGISTALALITMACSDVYANTVNDLDGPDPSILTTDGNFSADPLFCDTATQFLYLTTGSPCLPDGNSCLTQIGALGWHECECCEGIRGNIDNDPNDNIDISDLVWLVAYMFTGGPGPVCEVEADLNGDGWWDIGDLVYLINYMFIFDSPAPLPCPYII